MNTNELMEQFAEQFKAAGGDLNTAVNYFTTLATNGKTPLGLNQWQRSDKPVMEDFNEDNRVIDENLRELWEKKANADLLEKYALELAENILAYQQPCYCKDPFGVVTLWGSVTTQDYIRFGDTIGVLPAGFRPISNFETSCSHHQDFNGEDTVGMLAIQPDGIVASGAGKACKTIFFSVSYLAEV